ncbi:MAG: hypothetical protein IT279_08315 [Ignavibacteriaceae bacterium]|nr:hypothetical protein [Ignavibacteriaceae bacterium]
MNKNILTDSGYWLGLLDSKDQYHNASNEIADMIDGNKIIFPWPCLYETISTRLARRKDQLIQLEKTIFNPSRGSIYLINDNDYKEEALKQVFYQNRFLGKSYSLTDSVIREILKDINVKIDYFITFNSDDFRDICSQRDIELIDHK